MDHPQYHLLRFLQTFDDLSEREAIELSKQFIQMNLDTNEVFIAQNSIVEHVGYVVEGALCAFFINSEGEKENSYILSEGHFFSEAEGFYNNLPAKFTISAVIPTTLLVIKLATLKKMASDNSIINRIIRDIAGKEDAWVIQMLSFPRRVNAKGKYLEFKKRYPFLLHKIPDHAIASFFGISKYHYSRIKSKILRQVD